VAYIIRFSIIFLENFLLKILYSGPYFTLLQSILSSLLIGDR